MAYIVLVEFVNLGPATLRRAHAEAGIAENQRSQHGPDGGFRRNLLRNHVPCRLEDQLGSREVGACELLRQLQWRHIRVLRRRGHGGQVKVLGEICGRYAKLLREFVQVRVLGQCVHVAAHGPLQLPGGVGFFIVVVRRVRIIAILRGRVFHTFHLFPVPHLKVIRQILHRIFVRRLSDQPNELRVDLCPVT